jgi:hypothetical protein
MVTCTSEKRDSGGSIRLVCFEVKKNAYREDGYKSGEMDVEMVRLWSVRSEMSAGTLGKRIVYRTAKIVPYPHPLELRLHSQVCNY